MKVSANVVDVVPVLPLVHKGGQHVQSLKLERTVLAPQVEEATVVRSAFGALRAQPPQPKQGGVVSHSQLKV